LGVEVFEIIHIEELMQQCHNRTPSNAHGATSADDDETTCARQQVYLCTGGGQAVGQEDPHQPRSIKESRCQVKAYRPSP
jgi:hypothetical protein